MSEADSTEQNEQKDKPVPKGYKRKKQVPPVSFLLKHGDPETVDKKQTWTEMYGPPVMIMITFVLSFFVFYYFIENHTTHRPITLPRMPRQAVKATRKHTDGLPKRDSEL
jgi:flagellar biosynthesis protein FlhB